MPHDGKRRPLVKAGAQDHPPRTTHQQDNAPVNSLVAVLDRIADSLDEHRAELHRIALTVERIGLAS